MTSPQTYSIRDLSKEFKITPRTIRFYEDRGLINPKRTRQNRIYSTGDKARLDWILRGKRVGFSLSEIDGMLELYNLGDGRIKQREVTLKNCLIKIGTLSQQRDDIDETIIELKEFCETLKKLVLPNKPSSNSRKKKKV